jgi:hypothetical protein
MTTPLIVQGSAATVGAEVIERAVTRAAKTSGRPLQSTAAQRAAIKTAEQLVEKHGPNVLRIVEDGGLEILEAAPRYGDDFVELAGRASPRARRELAVNADRLYPLADDFGVEFLELEARIPGLAEDVYRLYDAPAARTVAEVVGTKDLPRFIRYAESADSPATRELLLETYRKHGSSVFERIPAKVILAGGLTAAMLYAVDRGGDALEASPGVVGNVLKHGVWSGAAVLLVLGVLLLWRFGLMPWHRRPSRPTPVQTTTGGQRPPSETFND